MHLKSIIKSLRNYIWCDGVAFMGYERSFRVRSIRKVGFWEITHLSCFIIDLANYVAQWCVARNNIRFFFLTICVANI
jgi:hypothetical protein